MEGERERQEGGGVQFKGRQRRAEGPLLHHNPQGPRPQADGADGGGQPQEDICQCSHLPHQLHLSKLWSGAERSSK